MLGLGHSFFHRKPLPTQSRRHLLLFVLQYQLPNITNRKTGPSKYAVNGVGVQDTVNSKVEDDSKSNRIVAAIPGRALPF
jgi:hypothetical protein